MACAISFTTGTAAAASRHPGAIDELTGHHRRLTDQESPWRVRANY